MIACGIGLMICVVEVAVPVAVAVVTWGLAYAPQSLTVIGSVVAARLPRELPASSQIREGAPVQRTAG
jgi:hypothetical protein